VLWQRHILLSKNSLNNQS